MSRAAKARAVKSSTKVKAARKPTLKAVEAKTKVATAKVATKPSKVAAVIQTASVSGKKQVSQKLLETIERRKMEKAGQKGFFTKPPGRRGRRPKNVEYTPGQNEEESYVYEAEHERLEYDTGIRVAQKSDDGALSMERFEEFDEELNFDW